MTTATATRITVNIDGTAIPADGELHDGWRIHYFAPFVVVTRQGEDYTVTGQITTPFECGRRSEETSPGKWEPVPNRVVMDAAKDNRPYILQGEAFWILNAEEPPPIWDESRRLEIRRRILPMLDLEMLNGLRPVLNLFGDSGQPREAPQGREWGWMRRYAYRLLRGDNAPFKGLLEGQVPQNGNGYSPINEYNAPFWLFLKFVLDGNPADWINLLEMMLSRVTRGTVWDENSRYYGLQRYPGGDDGIGHNSQNGWHDVVVYKQWATDLVWFYWLFPHPLFQEALDNFFNFFRARFHSYWGEDWGARNAAHQIQNLRLDTIFDQSGDYDEVNRHFNNALDLADDPTGWTNTGNGGNAPVSPWMQSELVSELATCSKTLFGHARYDEIISAAERVVETGTTYEGGKFRTYYRSAPPSAVRIEHPASHTGMMIATLRLLHEHDPQRWEKRWNDARGELLDFARQGGGLMDSNSVDSTVMSMVLHSVVRW